MFVDRKTMRAFADASNFLQGDEREELTRRVKELFDRKIVSENDEFNEFYITMFDLESIIADMNVSPTAVFGVKK